RRMDDMRLDPASNEPARQPEAVATSFIGQCNPPDRPASTHRLDAPPLDQSLSAVASGSNFFNGWRSTPGTTPLTSQLVLLISTTTTKVEIGSNAARLRLRSLTCSTRQPPSVRRDDEGATTSAAPSHSFSHLGCMTAKRFAACRMRSSACDTLARLCVR